MGCGAGIVKRPPPALEPQPGWRVFSCEDYKVRNRPDADSIPAFKGLTFVRDMRQTKDQPKGSTFDITFKVMEGGTLACKLHGTFGAQGSVAMDFPGFTADFAGYVVSVKWKRKKMIGGAHGKDNFYASQFGSCTFKMFTKEQGYPYLYSTICKEEKVEATLIHYGPDMGGERVLWLVEGEMEKTAAADQSKLLGILDEQLGYFAMRDLDSEVTRAGFVLMFLIRIRMHHEGFRYF